MTGTDPYQIRDFADTLGEETVNYVQELYETYQLAHLDSADASFTPIKPSPVINLILGFVVGIVLGICLALLAHYLQVSRNPALESSPVISISSDEVG